MYSYFSKYTLYKSYPITKEEFASLNITAFTKNFRKESYADVESLNYNAEKGVYQRVDDPNVSFSSLSTFGILR